MDLDIRMDMPTEVDRFLIFQEWMKVYKNNIDDQELKIIARVCSGFVSSDLAQIVRNSFLRAVDSGREEILKSDLEF